MRPTFRNVRDAVLRYAGSAHRSPRALSGRVIHIYRKIDPASHPMRFGTTLRDKTIQFKQGLAERKRPKQVSEPKPLPALPAYAMLSHLEEDAPVRIDGERIAVTEVLGMEIDEAKLSAFAGTLNALDHPVQLLVRQHPPRLEALRRELREAEPHNLPDRAREAAESLGVC